MLGVNISGGGGDKATFEIHSIIFLLDLRKDIFKSFPKTGLFLEIGHSIVEKLMEYPTHIA